MADAITIKALQDASLDAKSLEEVVNGSETKQVTTRLGETYPSVKKAIKTLFENGGLPAVPFSTVNSMTSSSLLDNDYAIVTDDPATSKNGIYQKKSGAWIYSGYNEYIGNKLGEKLTALDFIAETYSTYKIDHNNLNLAWGVVDGNGELGLGVTNNKGFVLPASTIDVLGKNNQGYEFAIVDSDNNVAFGIKKDGTIDGFAETTTEQPVGSLTTDNGDVFYVKGNAVTQLTASSGNKSPTFKDINTAKFVSDRLGRMAEYEVALDGSGEQLLYADNRKYEQIIITGQSLAQGGANAAITKIAPYPENAFKFTKGPVGSEQTQVTSAMLPLAESIYETISTGFAKNILDVAQDRKLLMSGQAMGGSTYVRIKKGGELGIYERCMQQVGYAQAYEGKSNVRAMFVIHGEADGFSANQNYELDMREWLDDFNADVKLVTGQTDNMVMLACQVSSASGYKTDDLRDDFQIPFAQLRASEENSDIYLVCPKYFFSYKDYAHILAADTQRLGEYYAKVYRQVVIEGNPWRPFSPNTFTASGNSVVIDFHVPKPPIVIDVTTVLEGADNLNKGFVLKDAAGVTITSVAITGDKQVTVTFSAEPPSGAVLSYAFHNGTYRKSGRVEGARGNLRDSDTTPSSYSSDLLHNWCVTFKHTFGA